MTYLLFFESTPEPRYEKMDISFHSVSIFEIPTNVIPAVLNKQKNRNLNYLPSLQSLCIFEHNILVIHTHHIHVKYMSICCTTTMT